MDRSPKTFLLVDDIELILNNLENHIKILNPKHKIFRASSVAEAKKVYNENKGEINFIISDWNMPEENGIVFLKYIRFELNIKNIPFVVLTTSNEQSTIMEALTLGASSYIFKPWVPNDLTEKLDMVWKKHNP